LASGYRIYVNDPWILNEKVYRLIWTTHPDKDYVGVINAFRRKHGKKSSARQDFLTTAELALARKLTRKARGSHDLPANASSVERAKYELCQKFVVYMNKNKVTQRQFAQRLGVSESRVSEILHYNIRKITIDKLVELLERVQGTVTLKVA